MLGLAIYAKSTLRLIRNVSVIKGVKVSGVLVYEMWLYINLTAMCVYYTKKRPGSHTPPYLYYYYILVDIKPPYLYPGKSWVLGG